MRWQRGFLEHVVGREWDRSLFPRWDIFPCSQIGTRWRLPMQVIARPTLLAFGRKHPAARAPLAAWFAEAKGARWDAMQDIKIRYATASILNHERVVFNIHGNDFHMVVFVRFKTKVVFIRFIGTHSHYNAIDALRV